MAYMHVNFAVTEHGIGYPANVLAQEYGEHILNVKLATDTDNGMLVAADVASAWPEFDVFDETAVTSFAGIVEQQMQDGTWLVCVTDPGDALFVYQKPLTPYESPRELTQEKAFYNKAGDIVRCYKLAKFDRIAVSAKNFSGDDPEVGATISSVSNKKMVVSAPQGATGATQG